MTNMLRSMSKAVLEHFCEMGIRIQISPYKFVIEKWISVIFPCRTLIKLRSFTKFVGSETFSSNWRTQVKENCSTRMRLTKKHKNKTLCMQPLGKLEWKIFNILQKMKILNYEFIPQHILILISNFAAGLCT